MKKSGVVLIVVVWLMSMQVAAESLSGTWRFSNGEEFPGAVGSIEVTKFAGGEQIELHYDFSGGGSYVAAYCDLGAPKRLDRVGFSVDKPLEATITVRVTDAAGQTFQKSLYYDQTGFQKVAFTMHGWAGFWGGPQDGVLRQPIHAIGVLIEKQGLSQPQGILTFKGLYHEVTDEADGQDTSAQSSGVNPYLVTDFGKECVLARSAGGALRNGVWHIDFNTSASASMTGSLSLFHRPSTLAIRVRSSAPGARLVFDIGAHFQGFRRVVGILDGTDQVFEFNVPPEGWEAYGAAHQTVHYPLRISRISIERHECTSEQIQVHLGNITCKTAFDASRAVVLMSELHETGAEQYGRGFTVSCSGWNLLDVPLEGVLSLEMRNWDGILVHATEMPLTLTGGGKREHTKYSFAIPAALRYIEVRCRFSSSGQRPAEALSTFTAPLTGEGYRESLPDPVRAMQPESPWGMGVYLYRNAHTPEGIAEMNRVAELAAEAGVKWSREEFQLSRIITGPGVYDFSFYDNLMDAAWRHGISVYALLAYWSPFAEPYTEEGIEAFCEFTRATVRHFKDRIKHWEIYNEPNIFFWDGPKELYPVLLERCYAIIKAEDPEAEVLGISTAGIDRGFIRLVLDAGAPFDALTIHPYRSQFIERNFIRELEHASLLVNKRPVWITEMGWSTQIGEGGKTEREQAQLLARAYLSAVGANVRNMGWYNFRNDGTDPFYNEMNFGVLRNDLTPKAAYRALASVCRVMAGTGNGSPSFIPKGDGAEGLYALSSGANTALWAPHDTLDIIIATSENAPVALNLMGETVALQPMDPLPVVPVQGCRSKNDAALYQELSIQRITLPKGDPVFLLDTEMTVIRVEKSSTGEKDLETILF